MKYSTSNACLQYIKPGPKVSYLFISLIILKYELPMVFSSSGNGLGKKESREFLLNCSYAILRYESVPQAYHLY